MSEEKGATIMKIKELLSLKAMRPLPVVMLSDTMRVAEQTLFECEASCVYIADGCKMIGVLSQEDFIRLDLMVSAEDPRNQPVSRHMRTHVISVDPEWSVIESLKLMAEYKARDLLVLEDDFPLAVFEVEDLIRALLDSVDLHEIENTLHAKSLKSKAGRSHMLSVIQQKLGYSRA
jgi:predicted transcriptional regulator